MAKVCPVCGGTQVNCPTCAYPPKRVLPKQSIFDRVYTALFGAAYWEVQGIDVSKWNGSMNFAKTKTKCQFGFMRLGYGEGWKDNSSDMFYAGASLNDFPMGVYWYCYIGKDVAAHATGFAEEIATHKPQLDIIIDAESTTLDPTNTLNWLKEMDVRLKNLTGKTPLIYTSQNFWNNRVARSSYFLGRMCWVANWTTRDYPAMPYDFSGWDWWQYSADGNLKASEYGSTGGDPDMDLDRSKYTVAQFNLKYGTHIKPLGSAPIPPVPGTLPEYVIINIGELAIHNTPQAVTTNVIGHALLNTKWYPYELVNVNGIEWYRVGKNAYISKNYTRLF